MKRQTLVSLQRDSRPRPLVNLLQMNGTTFNLRPPQTPNIASFQPSPSQHSPSFPAKHITQPRPQLYNQKASIFNLTHFEDRKHSQSWCNILHHRSPNLRSLPPPSSHRKNANSRTPPFGNTFKFVPIRGVALGRNPWYDLTPPYSCKDLLRNQRLPWQCSAGIERGRQEKVPLFPVRNCDRLTPYRAPP